MGQGGGGVTLGVVLKQARRGVGDGGGVAFCDFRCECQNIEILLQITTTRGHNGGGRVRGGGGWASPLGTCKL